jgi:hypothetical protein
MTIAGRVGRIAFMEIHRLTLSLTEKALNDLARERLLEDAAIEELEIRIVPEGVRVKGAYQMFVPVSFEAHWEVGVDSGRVTARLAQFRTLGMPANVLKSLIMNVIADAARKEPWLQIHGDTVRADVDAMFKKHGLASRTHLQTISCRTGVMIVEAGSGEPPPKGT